MTLKAYLTTRATIREPDLRTEGFLDMVKGDGEAILTFDDAGVAHISVEGVLTPNGPDFIDRLFGQVGTSYKQIISSLYDADEAIDDPRIPIILHVNSPGGTVNCAEATAAAVADVVKHRPVIAVNEGLMVSAAMWISSGATEIVTMGRSPLTGSVGVLATVVEFKSDNIEIHNFTNPESPDKVPDPSTREGAKVYENRVAGIYSVFIDDLVAGRAGRTTAAKVESLKGAVVTARDAIEAGLVDRIVDGNTDLYTPAKAGIGDGIAVEARDREEKMNLSEFLNEHPEAKAELDARISKARSEGEKAAGARHAEIVAKVKPFMDGNYPERVKAACAAAISGERSVESVLDLVAIFDEIKASNAGDASDEEQEEMPDTPSAGPEIKTEADAAVKRDASWNEAINGLLG